MRLHELQHQGVTREIRKVLVEDGMQGARDILQPCFSTGQQLRCLQKHQNNNIVELHTFVSGVLDSPAAVCTTSDGLGKAYGNCAAAVLAMTT